MEDVARGSSPVDASDRPDGGGKPPRVLDPGTETEATRASRDPSLPRRGSLSFLALPRRRMGAAARFVPCRMVANRRRTVPNARGDMPTATYWSAAFCSACALACAFTTCPTVPSAAMAEAGTTKHVLAADLALDGLGFGENIRTQEH